MADIHKTSHVEGSQAFARSVIQNQRRLAERLERAGTILIAEHGL